MMIRLLAHSKFLVLRGGVHVIQNLFGVVRRDTQGFGKLVGRRLTAMVFLPECHQQINELVCPRSHWRAASSFR